MKKETRINIGVKYNVGEKLKMGDRVYTCVGYEHIPSRSLRYIFAHMDGGTVKWEYFYYFETKLWKRKKKKTPTFITAKVKSSGLRGRSGK